MTPRPELLTRTITAAGIAAITLGAILYSAHTYIAFLALIAVLGGLELLRLQARIRTRPGLPLMPAALSLASVVAGYLITQNWGAPWVIPVLAVILVGILTVTIFHTSEPATLLSKGRVWLVSYLYPFLLLTAGLLFARGEYTYPAVLLPVMLIWINDVMAYLIGRQWGRRKIAPLISPGKSLEGTLGAAALTLLATLFVSTWFPDLPQGYALALGLLVPGLALAGDLWESAIKREAGVKDSGHLLPGHGGVLDRFDSLLFVLPVAALLYYIFAP